MFLKFVMDLKKVTLNKDKEALHGELIPTINKMYQRTYRGDQTEEDCIDYLLSLVESGYISEEYKTSTFNRLESFFTDYEHYISG